VKPETIAASASAQAPASARPGALAREYFQLTKPRVVALIVFTAMVGMLLSVPGAVPLAAFAFGSIGIALAAASAAALNHILDRRQDAVMARTHRRPLPAGRLTLRQALVFALALGAGSMLLLAIFVNALTAVLTFGSLIGYSVIYTVWLKHTTPQNIVIGGAAGAVPPVLGWTAVTGTVSSDALLLFLIVFVWTPPHFWALALYREKDYASASIPMMPVVFGREYTQLQILLYTILLCAVTVMPFATHLSGWPYLVGALVLNAGFLWRAWSLYRRYRDVSAHRLFRYSIQYLAALFALLIVDHYCALVAFGM
jgi:protoheme IX farnesyltransferase